MRSLLPFASSCCGRRHASLLLLGALLLVLACERTITAESSVAPQKQQRQLTLESMSQSLRKMEYAVRGKVVIAADQINDELQGISPKTKDYPFDHMVYTNIGNPQSVGQKPLTWPRQVLALTDLPDAAGIDHPDAPKLFPPDAIQRAREIKQALRDGHGSTGAYTHSKGVKAFRDDVAAFIQQRDDGVPADSQHIFLTNGASSGITMILHALIAHANCGVMIPIPQYPIYSATIDLLNGRKVGYYLDEQNGWALDMAELERAFHQAVQDGIHVAALVLINPGNPTGQVLSRQNLHDVCRFCVQHRLVLLADEVYQDNVYDNNNNNNNNHAFVSCKRAAHEVGLLDHHRQHQQLELVSFHSVSKGVFGECGRRGGYMELSNIDPAVVDQLYKLASSSLCSAVPGQIMVSLMVRGPAPEDASYHSHEAEKRAIFESLQRRAQAVSDGFNGIPGFTCQPAAGSMYCFPAVQMPEGAIRQAEREEGVSADTLYCLSLLQATGIVVVPASGFGQREGRYGFRSTFLPSEQEMERVVELIGKHYASFCEKYES